MCNQSNHGAWSEPCAEGAQARQCSSGLLGIPKRLAAWKSLTEDVLEFGVEVTSVVISCAVPCCICMYLILSAVMKKLRRLG